ncbi:cyclic nucleotide-binding domain-containing protein [bacterium]|nr:cyclic nucleotide-binding domain-containing protein [bacterium]
MATRSKATSRTRPPDVPLRKRDVPRLANGEIALRPARGTLFLRGANATDPRQGNIGDGYLLSALCAVARSSPRTIESMLRKNDDGTYRATFHRRRPGRRFSPEHVTFDGRVPYGRNGAPVYARASACPLGEEIWPLIAEKGYARWKGGFNVIGEGGMVEDTLEEITGQPTRVFYVGGTHPEVLWDVMRRATESNWPATACTYGRKARPELDAFGFHPWHIHVLLGCHTWRGHRIVWLRDPFDKPPAGSANLPDPNGVFTLAWEHFLNYFAELIVNAREIVGLPSPPYPAATIRRAIERSYVFDALDVEARRELSRCFRRIRVAEKETLFEAGSRPDAYYIIQSGTAGVFVPREKKRCLQLAILEAGDQFGEMALLDDTVRAAGVRAISSLVLYRMSATRFRAWIERWPELEERFRRRFRLQRWMQRWSKRTITSVTLDDLLRAGREESFRAGQLIVRQGEPARSFYLLLAGRAEVLSKERRVSVLEEGAVFGEAAALRGGSRTASVRALEATRLMCIDLSVAAGAMENFDCVQRQLEFVARRRSRRHRSANTGR